MPALTYTVGQFTPFTKIVSSDVNQYFTDIKTLLNTTKLDSTNVQQYGLSRDRIAAGTANYVMVNDSSGHISQEAQLAVSRGGLGVDLSGSLSANAGSAVIVNNGGTQFTLGSPLQSTITESLSGVVSSLTAGVAISANDACCLDVAQDGSGNTIYRVFKADSSIAGRRRSFLGFAQAAATVTAGIYTWVASANFVSSNVITFSINGRSYSVNFTTDNATTLQAVATAMATDPDVNGAVSDGSHTVTVTGKGGLHINITSSTVTGGASQATITVTRTQVPSGDNVKIQCFGPLDGFTSLTPSSIYYLSTGGGTSVSPSDTNPIQVGQALSSTVMFINSNIANYQFGGTNTFVRSHGSSGANVSSGTQDVEHFNYTSWSAGTSAGSTVTTGSCAGSCAYGSYLLQLDNYNASNSLLGQFQKYNKTSWSVLSNRGTNTGFYAPYEFNNYWYAMGGTTTTAAAGGTTAIYKWNGNAWSTTAGLNTAVSYAGAFVQNSLLHSVSGKLTSSAATTVHQSFNSSDTYGSLTASPNNGIASIGQTATGSLGIEGNDNSTNSYSWNGSAWSSAITISYNPSGTSSYTPGGGYNSVNAISTVNGGSDASTAINTSAKFNGTAWSSDTSSSNSRAAPAAGVI